MFNVMEPIPGGGETAISGSEARAKWLSPFQRRLPEREAVKLLKGMGLRVLVAESDAAAVKEELEEARQEDELGEMKEIVELSGLVNNDVEPYSGIAAEVEESSYVNPMAEELELPDVPEEAEKKIRDDLRVWEAVEIIAEMDDVDALNLWKERDERRGVQKAIEVRLDILATR